MNATIAIIVAGVLGALGLILILAGPVFHLLPSTLSLFTGLVCWIVAGVVKGVARKIEKKENE